MCVRPPVQDKCYSLVFELLGAVGARWGPRLKQNDRTDIEKVVLTPSTIRFELTPTPREKSERHFFHKNASKNGFSLGIGINVIFVVPGVRTAFSISVRSFCSNPGPQRAPTVPRSSKTKK